MVDIIDHHFQLEGTIASFLLKTQAGPVLIETGPHSTFETLKAGLAKHGFKPSDVKHVLLSHIHFDHAGAAWAFAKAGAQVYVHPVGYPHLQNPEKLYNSAKRIYGDAMESLWGLMEGIPVDQLHAVADKEVVEVGEMRFIAHHTPGHASHHIAWQCGDAIFTGDVAGCKIGEGPVVPPCPPPDINIEDWKDSIQTLRSLSPKTLYLTHYGPVTEIEPHLQALENMLDDWAGWMKIRWEKGLGVEEVTPEFKAYAAQQLREAGLNEHQIGQYEAANPAWMSVAGLLRYWKKRSAK
jgi:glyoxylase-like metal-dependent hydrolase (beta-lactamase superfamily II)